MPAAPTAALPDVRPFSRGPLPTWHPATWPREFGAGTAGPVVQRHARDAGDGHQAPVRGFTVRDVLRTAGRPLDEPLRAEMEQRLGADFSAVRIHTDAAAHASAQEMDAHAYTSGTHIVFQRGRYDSASAAGRQMLAHELTHVIQQRQGSVSGTRVGDGPAVSHPQDSFERAAEATARQAMARPLHATPLAAAGPARPVAAPAGSGTAAGSPPAVQRTLFKIDGTSVPGTEAEDTETLRAHLWNASWRTIDMLRTRGTGTASNLSAWDREAAVAVAHEVARERIDLLMKQYDSNMDNLERVLTDAEQKLKHAKQKGQPEPELERETSHLRAVRNWLDMLDQQANADPQVDADQRIDDAAPAPPAPVDTRKRSISPPPGSSAKIARQGEHPSAPVAAPPAAAGPTLQELSTPLLSNIFFYLPYRELHQLMRMGGTFWRTALWLFHHLFTPGTQLGSVAYGIVRSVARYSPDRTFASESGPPAWPAAQEDPALFQEVARAVGWRGYTSGFRTRFPNVNLTVRSFLTEVLEHARLTAVLRLPSWPPATRTRYEPSPTLGTRFKDRAKQIGEHWWKKLAVLVPPKVKVGAGKNAEQNKVPRAAEDEHADSVADLIGARGSGHNITVIRDHPQPRVYSNNALDPVQQLLLRLRNYRLTPTDEERSLWGPEHGIGRRGRYPLPFHSEMHRTLTVMPWEMRYAGNIYFACVQCMASYYALGIQHGPHGGYRGTHAAKVPSVIPPLIRTTSVYLQHYLGANVWEQVRAAITAYADVASRESATPDEIRQASAGVAEVMALLDSVEHMNTNFYTQAGISGAPTDTF